MDMRPITLSIEDIYRVVNVLRDACGCDDCRRIADDILEQNNAYRRRLVRTLEDYRERLGAGE